MLRLRTILASLLLALAGCATVAPLPDGWQPLAPGLAHRAWAPWPDSDVQALRVDLTRVRVSLSPPGDAGLPLDRMASSHGALASINASFFDREFRPRGLTVSAGQAWPALLKLAKPAQDPLLACDSRCTIRFDAPAAPEPGWQLAVSGTPWLVRDGQARTAEDDASCAQLCAHQLGRRGDVKGLTLAQTAELMRELGARHAFNLDGGGSSTLLIGGESRLPRPFNEPALRRVANALHLLPPP
jgi:hypothetical protein